MGEEQRDLSGGEAAPSQRDYYEILGVPREADAEAIKRAFRAHARSLHPDVSQDPAAPEKFRELSEAYSVLSKSRTRLMYDRFGYRGRGNGWFTPEGARAASDFLRRRKPAVAEVLVDEYEATRGVRRRVRWIRSELCGTCDGEGAAPGAVTVSCHACGGRGRRRVESSLSAGERLLQIEECDVCRGRGTLASEPCQSCGGRGATTHREIAEVDVPPASADGDRIPVAEGSRDVVVVRVLETPHDDPRIRYFAVVGLMVALVFLWILLR